MKRQFLQLKYQCKHRPLAFNRLYLDIRFMKHHDLFTEAKPNAAARFTGAEKRDKYFVEQFGGHTNTVIRNFDSSFMICCAFGT